MLTLLVVLGICGAAYGGYRWATKDSRVKALPSPKTMNKQPWVFPNENKDGIYPVSHILLYLMATEDDGVPEDWMTDVRRLEGDKIQYEHVHEGFWENFYELNKEFRKFDKEIDKHDEMKDSSKAGYQLYLNSLYEMKCEIYELAQACYEYMRINEQEVVEEEEDETEDLMVGRTVEEQKLLTIYHDKDSTPEMKAEAEYLLEELKKMNPESYTNPKLQDMELDMETIRRIVDAKKI